MQALITMPAVVKWFQMAAASRVILEKICNAEARFTASDNGVKQQATARSDGRGWRPAIRIT